MYLDLWRGDVRFAWRSAIRRPAFTLLVVVTLALGLGIGSAVFALVDAVLLKPLPYRDAARLVFVWQTLPSQNVFDVEAAPADFARWHSARSFSDIAMVSTESVTLTSLAEPQPGVGGMERKRADLTAPERVRGARVTASLMPLLGIAPAAGRAFIPDEDSDKAAPVVILSDGLWRRRFGARPTIVGSAIDVNGVLHTVVGVMPPATHLPASLGGDDDIWLPMRMSAAERDNEISHNYTVVGRLAPGATAESASSEMATLAAAQSKDQPATHHGLGARVVPVSEAASAPLKRPLLVLLGGVAFLVLVAAANAATLLLARTSERHQEFAVRSAIGASRSRLLSLAMAEALTLSTMGALAGIFFGTFFLDLLVPLFGDALSAGLDVGIGARASLSTLAVASAAGLALGALNAWQGPSIHAAAALQAGTRAIGGKQSGWVRQALVTGQIALAVLLLAIAGLLLKSYTRLNAISPGFNPRNVLTFRIALPDESYRTRARRAAFAKDILERLQGMPGVVHAALNSRMPFGGMRGANGIDIEGRPAAAGELRIADQREITPDYFTLMDIRMLRGRAFTERDDSRSEPVAIVNRAMARRFWGGADPVDQRVRVVAGDQESGWLRIVGVVDDVHHVSLARQPVPEMYRPFAQMPTAAFMVAMRTTGDPTGMVPAGRDAVQAIDRRLPIYDTRTMEARIAGSVAETRATAVLLLVTALLAASLAAIAIYGSIWYSVAQRTAEIGVRLALGAPAASLFRLVAGRAIVLTAIGAAIGSAGAFGAAPLLGSLLFDTRPAEPSTYVAVAGVLLALTLAASIVPARRAMRVDPLIALRT